MTSKKFQWTMILLSYFFGAGGMALWLAFLFFGPFHLIHLKLGLWKDFLVNTLLCVIFFIQHSLMVRQWFRQLLKRIIPSLYHGALYSISSGLALLVLVLFWQPSKPFISHLPDIYIWMILGVLIFCCVGFFWSMRYFSEFDALGIMPITRKIKGGPQVKSMALVLKGPYLLVRHPLYFLSLLIIWTGPVVSFDRILHNLLWTIWIYFGIKLEERDLVTFFGEPYEKYQAEVPMLIPNLYFWKK